jgi:roadblock/LC7 domain-containing protein
VNAIHNSDDGKIVYWHRELPPLEAELVAEHTVEATS